MNNGQIADWALVLRFSYPNISKNINTFNNVQIADWALCKCFSYTKRFNNYKKTLDNAQLADWTIFLFFISSFIKHMKKHELRLTSPTELAF